MPRKLILATANEHKVREIRELLTDADVEVVHLGELDNPPVLQEIGATFAENARQKALAVARQTGELALADDSGLEVDALHGEPGVHSARWAGEGAGGLELVAKLLRELADVPDDQRSARFVCVLSLCAPDGEIGRWEGRVEGVITREPRGSGGFGYDPVFLYPEDGMTFAEMTPERKNAVSHRGRALRAFAADLPRVLRQRSAG